ncbi:MAG: hypothetical protein PHF10_04695 [Patescibacteria group bacterium]|nr:hypothetical protein [Patescibacteria group bacterium]
MNWLKQNWSKILSYILKGFILYLCGAIIYTWLKSEGSVGERLCTFVIAIALIFMLTADFQKDIIAWFKKIFKE